MASDTIQLILKLRKLGCTVTKQKGSGHWRVRDKDGRIIGTFASTPRGGRRGLANTISELKRAGVPL